MAKFGNRAKVSGDSWEEIQNEDKFSKLMEEAHKSNPDIFIKESGRVALQYDNLIRRLGSDYSSSFKDFDDYGRHDLYGYIDQAFVELTLEYDPFCGVDFAGYIVKKLPLRIKHSYLSKVYKNRQRISLLKSEDYDVSDMVDHEQELGDRITTGKNNMITNIISSEEIDTDFRLRIEDIQQKVEMDNLDLLIFLAFTRGFNHYIDIVKIVQKSSEKYQLTYSQKEIRDHIKSLRGKLKEYYEFYGKV